MVTGLANVEHGVEVGGLARRGEDAARAALQLVDFGRHGVVGRVLESGVEIALGLEVEEVGHGLAAVIFEGGALDDGQHSALAVLGFPSALDADGLEITLFRHFTSCAFNIFMRRGKYRHKEWGWQRRTGHLLPRGPM